MLRRLAFFLPLLVGSAFLAGCDSNDTDDELTDAERIVGTWDATSADVVVQIDGPLGTLEQSIPLGLDGEGGIEMGFTAEGDYSLTAQGPLFADVPVLGPQQVIPEGPPASLPGTFVLNEEAGEIAFTGTQTGAVTVDVPYSFSGDDELRFTVEGAELIRDLILTANPDLDPTLADAVRGGSMTLTRR